MNLCWECQKEMDLQGYVRPHPWVHCHHEPKEKPKCWCEYDLEKKLQLNYAEPYYPSRIGVAYKPTYCPDCGRKL